jgi:hypothetical protein
MTDLTRGSEGQLLQELGVVYQALRDAEETRDALKRQLDALKSPGGSRSVSDQESDPKYKEIKQGYEDAEARAKKLKEQYERLEAQYKSLAASPGSSPSGAGAGQPTVDRFGVSTASSRDATGGKTHASDSFRNGLYAKVDEILNDQAQSRSDELMPELWERITTYLDGVPDESMEKVREGLRPVVQRYLTEQKGLSSPSKTKIWEAIATYVGRYTA